MEKKDHERRQSEADCFQFVEDIVGPEFSEHEFDPLTRPMPFDPGPWHPSRSDPPVDDLPGEVTTDFDFDPSQPFVA